MKSFSALTKLTPALTLMSTMLISGCGSGGSSTSTAATPGAGSSVPVAASPIAAPVPGDAAPAPTGPDLGLTPPESSATSSLVAKIVGQWNYCHVYLAGDGATLHRNQYVALPNSQLRLIVNDADTNPICTVEAPGTAFKYEILFNVTGSTTINGNETLKVQAISVNPPTLFKIDSSNDKGIIALVGGVLYTDDASAPTDASGYASSYSTQEPRYKQ
jgi:hypothetical protein